MPPPVEFATLDKEAYACPSPLGFVTVILYVYDAPTLPPFQETLIVAFWPRLIVDGVAVATTVKTAHPFIVAVARNIMESTAHRAATGLLFNLLQLPLFPQIPPMVL